MKKRVNGKTVDIDNIEVFEKAAEGLALARKATSNINISDNISFNSDDTLKIIELYKTFYSALPYPLYAIDNGAKYSALGTFIKSKNSEKLSMWVDDGLYVCIDNKTNIAIHFVNDTWGIVKVKEIKEDNTDIKRFSELCGYRDLSWALDNMLSNKGIANYYKIFMPKFIEACNSQPVLLRWELSNILEFGNVPEKIELQVNKIIDLDTPTEYTIDIFVTGTVETGEIQYVFNLETGEDSVDKKYEKTYGITVFEKSTVESNSNKKLVETQLNGANSLFLTLNLLRSVMERSSFDNYKAIMSEGHIIYEINKRVFICKAHRFIEPKEIARGVEIYSFDRGIVYMIKTNNLGNGIKKETIYSYSIKDGNIRLCKIRFVNN